MARSLKTGELGHLFFVMVLMYILVLGLKTLPAAADPGIKLVLNGVNTNPTVAVYIDDNGRTMVPLRFIMEHMGARVDWLAAEKGIVVTRGTTTLKMWIGSNRAYVNGQAIMLDTTPVIKENSTMVPVRFVSQAFGGEVDWNASTRTVTISLGAAENRTQIRITGSYVNIRSGPGLTYNIIEVLPRGTVVKLLTTTTSWYQVQLSNGRTGWVSASYAEPVPGNVTPPGNQEPPGNDLPPDSSQPPAGVSQVRITGSYVNFRSGPDLSANIIKVLPRGTVLKLLGANADWYQVQLSNGPAGWVSKSYAELIPVGTPSLEEPPDNIQPPANSPLGLAVIGTKPVAVLAGPTPVEGQVGTASPGSRLPIWQKQGNWWLVELDNGLRGWLAASLATFAPYQPPAGGDDKHLKITGIEVNLLTNAIQVAVKANGIFTYKTSRWDNRLVVDIGSATMDIPPGQEVIEVNRDPLARVRTGQFTVDTVRVVFDLTGGAALTSSAASDGGGLVFQLRQPSIRGTRIVIDPGHGTDPEGLDPGAIGPGGTMEKDVNLAISLKLADLLRAAGATVYLTRSGEIIPYCLAERAYYANDVNADIFISVHANASLSSDKSGTATFFYAPGGNHLGEQRGERQRLANSIQKALVAAIGRKDLGIQESNFSVLRNTSMPSVLVEVAFISNPAEEKLLAAPAFQARAAQGIFNGINEYISGN